MLRQWPPQHFAELIDKLVELDSVNVALIGSADERTIEQLVLSGIRDRRSVYSLVDQLELAELPEFIGRCALFVGNNSGPQHIAAALGIPTSRHPFRSCGRYRMGSGGQGGASHSPRSIVPVVLSDASPRLPPGPCLSDRTLAERGFRCLPPALSPPSGG